MNTSIRDNLKRIPKPRPKGTGALIGVRLQPPDLATLDRWIAAQPDPKPTRPEAIRRLLTAALEARAPIGPLPGA